VREARVSSRQSARNPRRAHFEREQSDGQVGVADVDRQQHVRKLR
jgi:hypothetical protein